ncbi:MAG: PAS domain S-box protein [Syntrophaceae bacterium]
MPRIHEHVKNTPNMGSRKKKLFDVKRLQAMADVLHLATGVSVAIVRPDGKPIASSGWCDICRPYQAAGRTAKSACQKTRAQIQEAARASADLTALLPCPLGLTEAATALIHEGKCVAYLVIGQFHGAHPRGKHGSRFQPTSEKHGFAWQEHLTNMKELPFIPPADARRLLKTLADLIEHPEGVAPPLTTYAVLHLDENTDERHAIATAQERTAQQSSDSDQWSATFDAMNDAVALIDPEGKILKCNRSMTALVGKPLAKILGRSCYGLIHGTETPIPDCPHVRAGQTLRRETLEMTIGERSYHFTVDPILDSAGHMTSSIHIISDITARKEVEAALRLSEEKYRTIFENATEGIFQTTEAGRYLSVNPAFARMFGFDSPREMMRTVTDIGRQLYVNPQDRARLVYMLKKWGKVDRYEVEVLRKDKSRFWISINVHTVRDAFDNILYFEGTNVDITERKRAEDALRESEARFRSLIQNSSDLIVIMNKDGLITYETPSMQRILGYSPGYLIGRSPLDFIHPENLSMTADDLEGVFLRTNDGLPTEFRFRHADGTWIYLEAIGKNLLDYPGINGVVITARDITERKHAEEEITNASQRYRDLVESTNEFFWELSPEWTFTYASPKSKDFLGYEAHELLNKPALDFMSRGELKRVWNAVRKQLEHGHVVNNFEHTIIQIDGRTIILESSILPVVNGGHAITGYRGVSRDITERKRLEDELAKVQKLDSIGTLAGGIAHDYNNLLTAILGYIGLCKTSIPKTDRAFELIEKAEKAALSARDLTKQLITFSRGGMPLRKVTDIRDLIRQTVKFSLSGSKLKPRYTFPQDFHPVFIDEDQMRQVIQNLVINAREAMHDNGELDIELANIQLEADNASSLPAGEYIRIVIRDQGTGIPTEFLPKVFDPYFSTKELGSQKGMGLGLSICYSIVKKHGGGIRLDSTVGVGTTASVFLPAAKP